MRMSSATVFRWGTSILRIVSGLLTVGSFILKNDLGLTMLVMLAIVGIRNLRKSSTESDDEGRSLSGTEGGICAKYPKESVGPG